MPGISFYNGSMALSPTSLSPPAATGSRPPLKCGDTSSQLVPSCCTESATQREGKQRVVILLNWLIVNRLNNRGYYSRTTFWRGECRYIECLLCCIHFVHVILSGGVVIQWSCWERSLCFSLPCLPCYRRTWSAPVRRGCQSPMPSR